VFRGKDGKVRVLLFRVRPRATRLAFLAALEQQRQAALGHAAATGGVP
jgi:hypothetical protein